MSIDYSQKFKCSGHRDFESASHLNMHSRQSLLATYVSHGGSKERKGKENIYVERKGEKVAFMGVEPTPSAIRADVLNQLD